MDSKGYPSQTQYGNQYGGFTPLTETREPPPQYMPQRQLGQPQYGQPQFGQPQFATQNVTVMQTGQMTYQSPPHDYTTQAFIACFFCFWPTGIFAIMKASESRKALAAGDYARANSAADSARTFVRISYGIGIAGFIISVVIPVLYVFVILAAYNTD